MYKTVRNLVSLAVAAVAMSIPASANTFFVNPNLTTGDDDGHDWTNALRKYRK